MAAALGTTALDPNRSYDMRAGGGTTTLVVNPFTRELERDFVSLSGTTVNCAGGITPWNSWVTCEETNAGPTSTASRRSAWLRQHGYCFDVRPRPTDRSPRWRFQRWAVSRTRPSPSIPNTWIVYETEDNGDNSGFYRFIPNTPGVLVDGGQLQMLAIEDRFQYDARRDQTVGVRAAGDLGRHRQSESGGHELDGRVQPGPRAGGARFARLEGCWWGNGAIYFADTSGGNAGVGQMWDSGRKATAAR